MPARLVTLARLVAHELLHLHTAVTANGNRLARRPRRVWVNDRNVTGQHLRRETITNNLERPQIARQALEPARSRHVHMLVVDGIAGRQTPTDRQHYEIEIVIQQRRHGLGIADALLVRRRGRHRRRDQRVHRRLAHRVEVQVRHRLIAIASQKEDKRAAIAQLVCQQPRIRWFDARAVRPPTDRALRADAATLF